MKKTMMIAALIALGALYAAAGTVSAETRYPTMTAAPAAKADRIAAPGGQTAARENVAKEWTLACYAEFGPEASNPDPALLEKCLN